MVEDKIEAARREGQIVIYASLRGVLLSLISSFRTKYKREHGHVSFYSAHPMNAYERIKQEIKYGLPTADLVILPHYIVLQMQREGLLRSYSSSETKTYPKEFYSPDGWATMAVEPTGFVYNPNVLGERELPTTVEELTDPKWKGRFAIQALTEYKEGMLGLYYTVALKKFLGEERWRSFLSDLAKNVNPTVFDCLVYMSHAIGRGDYHLGFPITLRKVGMVDAAEGIEESGRVEYLPLEDVPDMASFKTLGLMKHGSNPNTAELFYDFALSREFQEHLGQKIWGELPARPAVKTTFWVTSPKTGPTHYFPKMEDVVNFQSSIPEIRGLGLR